MRAGSIARRIMRAINRFGSPCVLACDDERTPFVASVQPVRDRHLQSLRDGTWGVGRRRRAVLFAPWCEAAARVDVDRRVIWQGYRYRVLQAEALEFAGQPLYVWAMLEPECADDGLPPGDTGQRGGSDGWI